MVARGEWAQCLSGLEADTNHTRNTHRREMWICVRSWNILHCTYFSTAEITLSNPHCMDTNPANTELGKGFETQVSKNKVSHHY